MIPALIVFAYLGVVLYIGIFAFRRSGGREGAEGYFLAGRSLGQYVFLLSLFGTNMTAFTILGSSGHAFGNGVVTMGLMASSSALIIPLGLFFIGTRMWALGKRFGFMTPVQMFRDRWECGHIGTLIFIAQAGMLVPYIIIGIIGGGKTMAAISDGWVSFELGGALVAIVVMSYVFLGGMRGTAWVNTFQTVLFLSFGAIAIVVIGIGMGGFGQAIAAMQSDQLLKPLLSRERVSTLYYFSYMFIPLSSVAFPHIIIFCLTAKKMVQFKKTVIFYPICILAIWLPCIFLGVVANTAKDVPGIKEKIEAKESLATQGSTLTPPQRAGLSAQARGDDVLTLLLGHYAPVWLAGILGAGIMAAVMAADSQILALSTMFTEDVFAFYGGKERFGERVQVQTGRVFVIVLTLIAYLIALRAPESIFTLAVQWAFSGYSALMPLLVAALFWRGSTKWGALASTVWVIAGVIGIAIFQQVVPMPRVIWTAGGWEILARTPAGTNILGFHPVLPMTVVSAILVVVVSMLTPKPGVATVKRYFSTAI